MLEKFLEIMERIAIALEKTADKPAAQVETVDEDDLIGKTPPAKPRVTQTEVLEAVTKAAANKAIGRDGVKKVFAKFNVTRATELAEENFDKFLAALKALEK